MGVNVEVDCVEITNDEDSITINREDGNSSDFYAWTIVVQGDGKVFVYLTQNNTHVQYKIDLLDPVTDGVKV